MKFSSSNFSEKIFSFKGLNQGILFTFLIISISLTFPMTAEAGIFSLFSGVGVDEVSAKAPEEASNLNSQNMALLKAAVNYDPNPNKAVDELPQVSGNALIPEIGPVGTVIEVDGEQTSTEISVYIVREGDSLSKIAETFGVSVNTIVWANSLGRNPVIKEGQMLIILPISGIRYVVKKGDTIKGIVSKHKADLDDVLKYNSLALDSLLKEGDIIMIPDAEPVQNTYIAGTKSKIVSNPVHHANGPSYPGYYARPVKGGTKTQDLHGYNAVDIAGPVGTPIYAAAEGTVIVSMSGGWNGGYGNYVIISHPNGTQTLYSHNSKNLVTAGQKVEKGQMIARMGATGRTTGSHVHFEIRGAKNPF